MRQSPATMGIKVTNTWEFECIRKGRVAWKEKVKNLVVADGLNTFLLAALKTGSAVPTWYVALIDNASFTGFNFNDAMVSHPGWFESIAYSEGTRQQWVPGTVANGYVDNAGSRASFTISVGHTVRGGFLTSNSIKNNTGGTLFGEAQFASPRVVAVSDVLIIKLACQVTSS